MDVGYVVGILGSISSIMFAFLAFRRNDKRDTQEKAQAQGTILTELGYIKSGVDDIKIEQRDQRRINGEVASKLATLETKVDRAHSRLDRLEKHEDEKECNL